jgi:hypothetical protein
MAFVMRTQLRMNKYLVWGIFCTFACVYSIENIHTEFAKTQIGRWITSSSFFIAAMQSDLTPFNPMQLDVSFFNVSILLAFGMSWMGLRQLFTNNKNIAQSLSMSNSSLREHCDRISSNMKSESSEHEVSYSSPSQPLQPRVIA